MTNWRLVPHTGPHPTLADHARHLDVLRQLPEQIVAGEAATAAGVAFRPGSWCDVFALPDGRLGQVAVNGATVTCYVEDAIAWVNSAPEPLGFCRCVYEETEGVNSYHQGQSGQAWMVCQTLVLPDGITFGVQPVALDPFSAYIVRSPLEYDKIDLATGASQRLPSGVPGSSQGISDVPQPNDLWWADLHRSVVIHGVTLFYPNQRGGLLVGQCPDGGVGGSLDGGPVRRLIPAPLACFEPHVAVASQHTQLSEEADDDPFTQDRYAVCARTPIGAAWLTFTSDDFAQFPLVSGPVEPPEQPPTDPPVPPIQPPTEPPVPPTRPQGDIMQFAQLDGSKAVPYIELRKSAQAGCVNVILPDGRVLSAHGDDRDPGTDGPWEQGQVSGGAITYRADGAYFTYLIVPVDKLP